MRGATEADPIGREYCQRLIAVARTEARIKIAVAHTRDDF